MSFDWTDDLQDAWDKTPEEGEQLPPGEYLCSIERAKIETVKSGKNKGCPMLILGYQVIKGELEGREVDSLRVLKPDTIKFTKWELARLDINVNSLSDLEDALKDCLGTEILIKSVHRDGFVNYNVVKQTTDAPASDAPW